MLIIAVLYCALVMPRFCSDLLPIGTRKEETQSSSEKLPAFSEIAGIVIFFGTALALMLQAYVLKALPIWQICLTGAVLMIFCGVLGPAEACKAVPVSMLLLIIGALAMSGAQARVT